MGAIDVLSASSVQVRFAWQAQDNLTGTDYSAVSQASAISKSRTYASTTANAAAGGADLVTSYLISIAGAGNTTIDFQSLTQILQQSANYARVKAIMVRLLSTTDDATNGTAASSITFGNSGANAAELGFGANTHTWTVKNGGCFCAFDDSAGGWVIDSDDKDLFFLNDDASVTAKIQLSIFGGTS